MYVVFVVVAAVVVFAVVAMTLGRGDLLDDEPQEVAGPELGTPEASGSALRAEDLDDLRFAVVARGYRMDQVDEVIRRLGREMAQRDERVAELEIALRQATPLPQRPRPSWGDTAH